MEFYETIENNGMARLCHVVEYTPPKFTKLEKVKNEIISAVKNERKIFIIGDYDVDGLMCDLVIQGALQLIGYQNYDIYKYRKRMHALDPVAVQECIQGNYGLCIIADCGSNDITLLKKLSGCGIHVVLLDHHETKYNYADYGDGIEVINVTKETEGGCLSAGALCYCVMSAVCADMGVYEGGISAYALISLYADCMDMSDLLNRSIYFRAVRKEKSELPHDITMFMNEWQVLSARFITFWFSPRVNALFRSENFDVINKLFLIKGQKASVIVEYLALAESIYENIRNLVIEACDILEMQECNNFVVGCLDTIGSQISIDDNRLWNYTGLIANKCSDRFSKPAMVYCSHGNEIKGSVRDIFGRNLLVPFQMICQADGHHAAFGFYVSPFDFEDFIRAFMRLDTRLTIKQAPNKPLIFDYVYNTPDASLIEDIARINEFAGRSVPIVLLRKQRVGDIRERKTNYGFRYSWGDYIIQSSFAVSFGSYMLMRPVKGVNTKLMVQ